MTPYSKEKFLEFNKDRQVKICLDAIKRVETSTEKSTVHAENWDHSLSYLQWLVQASGGEILRLRHLLGPLRQGRSLRQLMNVAISLERYLGLAIRDESFLGPEVDRVSAVGEIQPLRVVLHNIRSAFNVGSIFRSAEGLGLSHIDLVGYTPSPEDPPVRKTAMGAHELVSWRKVEHFSDLSVELRRENIQLVALETGTWSQNLYDVSLTPEVALILGNERFGLDPTTLETMDCVLRIPMRGRKNSLNVANAFGIAASEILRSWR